MGEDDKKKKASVPKRVTKQTRPSRPPAKVDVDRQCGVPLPGGGLCARSLTCKTHSVGAKRAVTGRSRPYNILLAEYQQRNQVKQAQRNTVSARHEEEALEQAAKSEKPLTDKEEVDQVLRGVIMSQPLPLSRAPPMVSTRSRTRFVTLREMLLGSVNKIPPVPTAVESQGTSLASVMSATAPILGRCVVFNPLSGAQTTRPARLRMRAPARPNGS